MNRKKLNRLVYAALFASLVCVGTMIIHIPTPTNGYVHLGDGLVLLAGFMLDPLFGAMAAGIGSMLADIFSGYTSYALATFIIKAAVALVAHFLFKVISRKNPKLRMLGVTVGGIAAEILMIAGYFIFESTVLGYGLGAVASIAGNAVQGFSGIILGAIFTELLYKLNISKRLN